MGANTFLDQMLKTGAGAWAEAQAATARARASGDLDKYAKGAAVGGLLGLLLGTRRGRAIGGSALKLGSVAAIGALAWKAYQDHQAAQQGRAAAGTKAEPASLAPAPAIAAPARFEALPAPQLEQHSRAMLKAMIAAAKSDGHMDEREQGLVQAELARLQADPEMRVWVEAELRRPVDPAEVAGAATTPEMAAEVYLASLLVVDETTTMERAYLDELGRALKLAPGLKADLEARAAAARG
jgi:uncharacterized membrane protein YebE (DUF533 family)